MDWYGIIPDVTGSECSELLLFCVKIKVCILVAAKIASGRGEAGAWEDGEGVRVLESVPCVCEPAAAAKSLMCA